MRDNDQILPLVSLFTCLTPFQLLLQIMYLFTTNRELTEYRLMLQKQSRGFWHNFTYYKGARRRKKVLTSSKLQQLFKSLDWKEYVMFQSNMIKVKSRCYPNSEKEITKKIGLYVQRTKWIQEQRGLFAGSKSKPHLIYCTTFTPKTKNISFHHFKTLAYSSKWPILTRNL